MNELLNTPTKGDVFEILRKLEDKSVDLVLTDIPYGEVNRESNGLRKLDKGAADVFDLDLNALMSELDRVCKGSIYVFCGFKQFSTIMAYFKEHGFSDRCVVWEKTNPSPMNAKTLFVSGVELCAFGKRKNCNATYNGGYANTVLRYPISRKIGHSTPKNLNMFKYLIQKSSNEGDTVLDPFAGSFTTAVAAKELGRNFVCSDVIAENVELGKNRLAELDKQKKN